MPRSLTALAVSALLVLAACGSSEEPTERSTSSAQDCTKESLETKQDGQLTVATDKPAYPPYFIDDEPSNGKGFESAVAYAIADQLGFAREDVKWTVVPFNSSYAPGPKQFDFDVNEVSITPQRQKRVDFSESYYTAPQAVVAPKGSPASEVGSLADLKEYRIGVQLGTTSLDAVNETVQPSDQPKVFNDSNDVVSALKQQQVDAVVVDLPTAFYLTSAQVPSAAIVGQFAAPGGDSWGALLEKDSPLTACVTEAVKKLKDGGELQKLEDRWMGEAAGAPELQ